HQGGATYLLEEGVAEHVVKADVASLYPSLIRAFRIGPSCDRLGIFLHLIDRLTELRLFHKAAARSAPPGSIEADQHEGTQAAMVSHAIKKYALLTYGGEMIVRGAAMRSSRSEPFGVRFLLQAFRCAMLGDVAGIVQAYQETQEALRLRLLPASDVATRMRLSKDSKTYLARRAKHSEAQYEALLAAGRTQWRAGE